MNLRKLLRRKAEVDYDRKLLQLSVLNEAVNVDDIGLIIVRAENQRIVLADRSAQEKFMYRYLYDVKLSKLIPENVREKHDHHFLGFHHSPSHRTMKDGLEVEGVASDGSPVPCVVSLSDPIVVDRQTFYAARLLWR